MAKILLIRPWDYRDEGQKIHDFNREWRHAPHNLLILGTTIKNNGHKVRILDLDRELVACRGDLSLCLKDLAKVTSYFRPDVVGVSLYSCQVMEAAKAIAVVRLACRSNALKPLILAGGIHPTVEPETCLSDLVVDYVFVGEADNAWTLLADGQAPETIPGFLGRNGRSAGTKGEEVDNLDELPFPDWSLCDYKFYSHPNHTHLKSRYSAGLDIIMSRGGDNQSDFYASGKSPLRFHSPEYLVEQVEYLSREFETRGVYFPGSSIGLDPGHLIRFCELMIVKGLDRKMEWHADFNSDRVNEEILRLMWKSGCRRLYYKFESGSQRLLDMMGKQGQMERNIRTTQIHTKLGFPYQINMTIGYPGETLEDVHETIKLVKSISPPRVEFSHFIPFPGSSEYNKLKNNSAFSFADPTVWRLVGKTTPKRNYSYIFPEDYQRMIDEVSNLTDDINNHNTLWQSENGRLITGMKRRTTVTNNQDQSSGETGFIKRLRDKWKEIPSTRVGRILSSDLMNYSDNRLLQYWEECHRETCTNEVRGWFQQVYRYQVKNKQLADIGPGLGLDGIFFAQQGAKVTFVDIVMDNLELLRRICELKGIEAQYYYIDDFFCYNFKQPFDLLLCVGSLIHTPFEFAQKQVRALQQNLRTGGRVLMLGYPKERYILSGAKDGREFAKMTDGETTPWAEWYDDDKIKELFGTNFHLNWARNFGRDNVEFNWFELTKLRSTKQETP